MSAKNTTTTNSFFLVSNGSNNDDQYDDDDFAKFIQEAMNKSKSVYISSYVNDEDYYFIRRPAAKSEFFPIAVIVLMFICIVSIIVCLIYSRCTRKTRRHPIYSLLSQYLFFNILLSLDVCLKCLSSTLLRDSYFYLHKTSGVCSFHQFIEVLVSLSQSFQLALIWLILLAERSIFPRFRFLYADFELEQTLADGAEPRAELRRLREKTFQSCVGRNARRLLLGVFYTIGFFLAIFLSPSYVYAIHSTRLCVTSGYTQLPHFLRVGYYFFFFFPLLYYMMAASTCFGKYFGGELDALAESMQPVDRDRVTLTKRVTILKCVIEVLLEVHSSSYLVLPTVIYEAMRLLGFLGILATTVLFFRYENFYSKVKEAVLERVGGGGSSGFGDGNRRGFIFRGAGGDQRPPRDSAVIDYTNLVDNEN